jgi:hypothetical protein
MVDLLESPFEREPCHDRRDVAMQAAIASRPIASSSSAEPDIQMSSSLAVFHSRLRLHRAR